MDTFETIDLLHGRATSILNTLRNAFFEPAEGKTLERRYRLKEVSEMIGKSQSSIYRAQEEGYVPEPEKLESGRLAGYTLEQVNQLRDHFGTRPFRAPADDPVIVSIQNFKGGVGKSTIACHAAQYLAQRGYRVLIVDCDSQASTTATFGYNPDTEIGEDETLLNYLIDDQKDGSLPDINLLKRAVRATHWDGLDLIPANLDLYNAEYIMARRMSGDSRLLNRLKQGLEVIAQSYDVVVIDPPPALGMISLAVCQAANAIVVPAPPSTIDFSSTTSFLSMMRDVSESLGNAGMKIEYKFIRFLITKADVSKSAQKELRDAMGKVFSDYALPTALLSSVEYDTAALEMRTIYELAEGRTRVHERARRNMDQVFSELELEIRKTWPSHKSQLVQEGRG
jgi:chromosome partitioning protein